MSKVKIYELAKQIDKQSKDIITVLKDNGIEAKSHMSNIEESQAEMIKKHFSVNSTVNQQKVQEKKPTEDKKIVKKQTSSSENTSHKTAVESNNSSQTQNSNIPVQGGNATRPAQSGTTTRPAPSGTTTRPAQSGTTTRPAQSGTTTRPAQSGTTTRPAQSGNYTRPAQGDSTNRPVQTGNYNRPAQSGNYNRPTQSGTTNRPAQSGNYNRPTQGDSTNRPAQSGNYNRPTQGDSTNRPAQSGNYNRPAQSGTTNRPTQSGNYNRPAQSGTTNRPAQSGNYNRPTQGDNTNRPAQSGNYNRPAQSGNYNKPAQGGNTNRPAQGYNNNRTESNTNNNQGNNRSNTGNFKSTQGNNDNRRPNNGNRPNQGRYKQGNYKNNNDVNAVKKNPNRKGAFIMPKPLIQVDENLVDGIRTISIPQILTIKELGDKMKIPAAVIVKKLFLAGEMVSINSEITFEKAEEIAVEYDCIAEHEIKIDVIEELLKEDEDDAATLKKRPPVVCVMGHVDHGKTSLLDAIRQTHVTTNEAGGITQHIGAYVVDIGGEKITFLDTPGHEAFTSMRMRGAQSTDIAILVVAADDGVMPQTIEAISHAKAAGIEIIVAINKIDKASANIDRVKQELTEYELVAEDWGGSTVFVPVSAHTKEGIEQLLEMINLTAEVLELKANPDRNARGVVIEAELDKGRGPVATILVQKGTLNIGDSIAIGSSFGKVRAMMDDKGRRVKEANPSTPVEILGLNEVPNAGEIFMATDNEKEARNIAEAYIKQGRERLLDDTKSKLSLDGLFSRIQAGNIKELNIIVKADVQGSVEAVKQSLLKLSNEEVAIRILHGGVGTINESDVILAATSNAIIIGFNVRPDNTAKETADREKVDLRLYRVIYNAIEDIEAAMKGMLDPIFEEKVLGHAEVRQVFKASGLGTIAGSYVLDGKIVRNSSARILRAGTVIYDGPLASLKRFKDDVKEVASGYECGLVFDKFNDIKEEDTVEIYAMVEVPR